MTQSSNSDSPVYNGLSKTPQLDGSLSTSQTVPSSTDALRESARQSPTSEGLSALSPPDSRFSNTLVTSIAERSRSSSQSRSQSRSRILDGSLNDSGSRGSEQNGYRQLIYKSFAPRIAVFASPDTEEFIRGRGFAGGFCSLLRPFGENVQGKVIIRDSVGGSKTWEGFGVRFVDSSILQQSSSTSSGLWESYTKNSNSQYLSSPRPSSDPSQAVESSLRQYINTGSNEPDQDSDEQSNHNDDLGRPSIFEHYLRNVLSSTPMVPYESFSHPVACLITVSSRNPAPIDTLRHLYAQTSHASNKIPTWIGSEYLRYYILLHDDENDDITKSTALFDLMKRHFGLHCHLLRLKSSRSKPDQEDSIVLPPAKFLSADEDMAYGRMNDYVDNSDTPDQYLSEADAVALNTFLREMVVQSIVPFMESRVVTWNDQVASRRRGISGRFMSLSKRFAGFGSSKNSSSTSASTQASSSNFNVQEGYYLPHTPEATMRQLADYAFMLRDWKLAYTTYDILRSDFGHDKAWHYHAAANEMAAITSLLNSHNIGMRYRADLVDQMLDTATYSYITRCSMPWGAIRCLTIALELLKSQGPPCADDGRRWGCRLLECDILKPYSQALTTGRIADCYEDRLEDKPGNELRSRQAAFWNMLTSSAWSKLDKTHLAQHRIHATASIYRKKDEDPYLLVSVPFPSMQELWKQLLKASKSLPDETETEASTTLINASIQQVEQEPRGRRLSMAFARSGNSLGDINSEGFTTQDAGGILMYDDNEFE